MKRAKQPPHPELVGECQVIADMLDAERRDEIPECPALGIGPYAMLSGYPLDARHPMSKADWTLACLTQRAMAEYLRLFPKARKPNNDPWAAEPQEEAQTYKRDLAPALEKIPGLTVNRATETYTQIVSTGETDYQCFFCRKSLFTRPTNDRFKRNSKVHHNILRHTEVCAVRLLAGLMKPHPPLPKGKPGL